jgi:hypothetical protein
MAAINFALLFLSITTRFYPPKDIIFKETATRTEDLGFYASTNIQLLPTRSNTVQFDKQRQRFNQIPK